MPLRRSKAVVKVKVVTVLKLMVVLMFGFRNLIPGGDSRGPERAAVLTGALTGPGFDGGARDTREI